MIESENGTDFYFKNKEFRVFFCLKLHLTFQKNYVFHVFKCRLCSQPEMLRIENRGIKPLNFDNKNLKFVLGSS